MNTTKWSPPLKCYIYLIPSISNYCWHIYPQLHFQRTISSSDSLMNINSCNPLSKRLVSDSLELMNTFFSYQWNWFSCLPFYKKNNKWSQVVATGEKVQAHPAFDLVIWQSGLPATESLHLWCDMNQNTSTVHYTQVSSSHFWLCSV